MTATIRPAQAADFEAIAAITNHYIRETCIHFGYEPVDPEALRAVWRAAGRHVWLVAETDGAVVGYAKSGPWRERPAYAWTAETGIYLDAQAHGRGLGRTLYAALLEAVTNAGFHSAIGGIALPNPASVRLHEALGFTHVGTFREVGWKFETWHDVGFWQRLLVPPGTPAGIPPA